MANKVYVLEVREGNPTQALSCLVSKDLDIIKNFIEDNKDFYKHDQWWWVILEGKMDQAKYWNIHSVYSHEGQEIENQPVPVKQPLEEAFEQWHEKNYPETHDSEEKMAVIAKAVMKSIWTDGANWANSNT